MTSDLEDALRGEGFPCGVEARERLAILTPDRGVPISAFAGADVRQRIERLARSAGFSHVAVELDPRGAPLHRP